MTLSQKWINVVSFFPHIFISEQIHLLSNFDIMSEDWSLNKWSRALHCNKPFLWETLLLWIEIKAGCLSFMETILSWNEHRQKMMQLSFLMTNTSWEREIIFDPLCFTIVWKSIQSRFPPIFLSIGNWRWSTVGLESIHRKLPTNYVLKATSAAGFHTQLWIAEIPLLLFAPVVLSSTTAVVVPDRNAPIWAPEVTISVDSSVTKWVSMDFIY